MHAYKEEDIESEYSNKHKVIASSSDTHGEVSDGEEVEDEFVEKRGLVDGKIRRDDEYDEVEDYEGIVVDESVTHIVFFTLLYYL